MGAVVEAGMVVAVTTTGDGTAVTTPTTATAIPTLRSTDTTAPTRTATTDLTAITADPLRTAAIPIPPSCRTTRSWIATSIRKKPRSTSTARDWERRTSSTDIRST